MTTKELAEARDVSEATVVPFVAGIGYDRYNDFQQALRDFVDTELTPAGPTRHRRYAGTGSGTLQT
jgi:DNA-binding MurR/RpiR family transcriptional regulator